MTYKELKDFTATLNEDQLQQEVMLWGEEECRRLSNGEVLPEDYYCDEDDRESGCFPLSEFTDNSDDLTELVVAVKAGTVVLHLDF